MNKESIKGLEEIYKHVYECVKCKTRYGSDKEEKKEHLCPNCDPNFKNKW